MCKTIVSILTIVVLVVTSGGGFGSGTISPQNEDLFTFDYEMDEAHEAYFCENDDFHSMLLSTPFYMGRQTLPLPGIIEFESKRLELIEDAMEESAFLAEISLAFGSELDESVNDLFHYLDELKGIDDEMKEVDEIISAEIGLILARRAIIETHYDSLDIDVNEDHLVESLIDYVRTLKAVQLGAIQIELLDAIQLFAAVCIDAYEDHDDVFVREQTYQLDEKMAQLDMLIDDVDSIIWSIEKIDFRIHQILTADWHGAMASIEFIEDSMPELDSLVTEMSSNENMSEEDISFISEYLKYYGDFSSEIKEKLLAQEDSMLNIDLENSRLNTNTIYAGDRPSHYDAAIQSSSTELSPSPPDTLFGRGWNAVKSAGSAVSSAAKSVGSTAVSGVKAAGRTMRRGTGVILDTADVVTYTGARLGYGAYYGERGGTAIRDIGERVEKYSDDFIDDRSGADVLKTAGEYLDYVEDTSADIAGFATYIPFGVSGDAARSIFGEGRLSRGIEEFGANWAAWSASGVARVTTGFFTGLGQGIYRVADADASASDILTGMTSIGLSAVGGSKVLSPASRTLGFGANIASRGLKVARGALGVISRRLPRSPLIDSMSNAVATKVGPILNRASNAIKQRMVRSAGSGAGSGGNVIQQIAQRSKQSMNDLFNNNYSGMKGIGNAILDTVGRTPGEYFDNLASSWIDDYLGDGIKEGLDWLLEEECDEVPPDKLEGQWSGTVTIESIE